MIRHTITALLLIAGTAQSQTAEEIIRKAEEQLRGTTSSGTYQMTVVTPEFTRTMEMKTWWDEAADRSLILITAPKKEAGNKWLKIGNEMWNYLKATETTVKIPPSMMLQSWNGSDFTNDDLARESSLEKDYSHTLLGEEEIRGETCWKISSIPRPDAAVVWGKIYTWVRKDNYLSSFAQYYDERGRQVRSMVFTDIRTLGGRSIPTLWTIHNKTKEGNKTEFLIKEAAFNISIPERMFSFRELERGN